MWPTWCCRPAQPTRPCATSHDSSQPMNSKYQNSGLAPNTIPGVAEPAAESEVDLGRYLEALIVNKWLILAIVVLVTALGAIYAMLQRPVYEANLVVQVEDSEGASKNVLGEASTILDVKTPAAAEIEIIRSRTVIGEAVDATHLNITAIPRYAPYVGGWLARRATGISDPGFLGMAGYVTGTERIVISRFALPSRLEGQQFIVTAQGDGRYTLNHPGWQEPLQGSVGTLLKADTPDGPVELFITTLAGKRGADFYLSRVSRQATIENVQSRLGITERGKQSGIINVSMQDSNASLLAGVLNAIGAQYVRQNIERRAAEAQKTLGFLDVQLPLFKKQLEQSEEVYNRYRNQQGTVAFGEEANLILAMSVDRQTKLLEAQQKRTELEQRFTSNHPAVQTLDAQISALKGNMADIQTRIKALPAVQQEAVRMERDVKVNTELYQSLLNNAMQLRLVKEGKVGNVRILDEAEVALAPIKPQRKTIVGAAFALGLFLGIVAALVRNMLVEQRIQDPHEVESHTGLAVFSTIPISEHQAAIAGRRLTGVTGVRLLAIEYPDDPTVESLRSLRTAMQFAMLESPSNRIIITGATPGVGKSFVSANFSALMAAAGKKTLLVDADMRRGHLHQYLGLQRHGGLSELIAGSLTVQQTVHRQVVPNLDFLATGQLPPNPAELLTSESFSATLKKLSELYDLVVIDTPPVLVASDTSSIATHAGTVLLIARANLSTMGELKESTRRLSLAGKAAAGVLLNGMDSKRRAYGNYKYGRYRYTSYNYESILPEEQ
ncbi:polysaccharide biosynthesis tyrosine autokinase [Variovorax sp. J22R133]|uniref:polysaccharide biosynthesis tyrosine autokinase n=1 Tax=Variovorax brevis TaxID=3053503 RepID=UPI0025756CB7|nr:polysaccharide biosynthesis tyrosine autokinase [Variovorax sp. J22R133]MDM0114284.1 polysaccharide biosynthesis tyrosine autokinase [Variovorax sp. J22R133]